MPGVVLAAGRVRDLEAAGEDEGNHVGVDELLGEAGEHAVDADTGGELGQHCGQTLVQTCKRCLIIFRCYYYCFLEVNIDSQRKLLLYYGFLFTFLEVVSGCSHLKPVVLHF